MDMMAVNNDSGIQSLSGFAYQIRVFVYYMSQMQPKMQIEFETLEDIAIKHSDTLLDDNSNVFRSLLKNENGCYAIQVKRTAIDTDSKRKILYNWLLLESKGGITKYILFTDGAYKNTDDLFNISPEDLFAIVTKSSKNAKALVSKVKFVYGEDSDKFAKAYNNIKKCYSFISEDYLDQKILDGFSVIFRREGVSDLIYALRIQELIRDINGCIITTIDKKTPYICDYKTMMQKSEAICSRVREDFYEPDYAAFKKAKKINLSDQMIASSREYKQLLACNMSDSTIERHLIYHQYYQNVRYRYFEDNKLNVVENIEATTYENFCDVKEHLLENNTDTPGNRLRGTKEKPNCHAKHDQTRFGSCIHLTTDTVDGSLKISWKDDECEQE